MAGMDEAVAELAAEHGDLHALLAALADDQWLLPEALSILRAALTPA